MRIDTSFPDTSKYFLWLDVPYRYAARHFQIAFNTNPTSDSSNLSWVEKGIHFSLGLLHVIPAIGHIAAIANRIFNPPNHIEEDLSEKKGSKTKKAENQATDHARGAVRKANKHDVKKAKNEENSEIAEGPEKPSGKSIAASFAKLEDWELAFNNKKMDDFEIPLFPNLQTHTPATEEEIEETEEIIQVREAFKMEALQLLQEKPVQQTGFLNDFSIETAPEELKEKIREINLEPHEEGYFEFYVFPNFEEYQFVRENHDRETIDGESTRDVINESEKQREYIQKNHLYLLHVPEKKMFEFEGSCWRVEECIPPISHTYYSKDNPCERGFFEKKIHTYCWNDPDLKKYIHTLFSQLIPFVWDCNVNIENYFDICFTKEGRIGLHARERHQSYGPYDDDQCPLLHLLQMLPADQMNHFIEIVKQKFSIKRRFSAAFHLNDDHLIDPFVEAKEKIDKTKRKMEVKEKAKKGIEAFKKQAREYDYSRFLVKNLITTFSQPLIIPPENFKLFEDNENYERFARTLLEFVNEKLTFHAHFVPERGRTIYISCKEEATLISKAREIWGEEFRLGDFNDFGKWDNKKRDYEGYNGPLSFMGHWLPEVMDRLKEAGYFLRYKEKDESPTFEKTLVIRC